MSVVYFKVEDLQVGQVIKLAWVKRYQHGATMRITKINKKTIIAEEVKGSYGGPRPVGDRLYKNGRPATVWNIHKTSNFAFLPNYDNEEMAWNEGRMNVHYPEHYDWSK